MSGSMTFQYNFDAMLGEKKLLWCSRRLKNFFGWEDGIRQNCVFPLDDFIDMLNALDSV